MAIDTMNPEKQRALFLFQLAFTEKYLARLTAA
jgi:hypothetical protein